MVEEKIQTLTVDPDCSSKEIAHEFISLALFVLVMWDCSMGKGHMFGSGYFEKIVDIIRHKNINPRTHLNQDRLLSNRKDNL